MERPLPWSSLSRPAARSLLAAPYWGGRLPARPALTPPGQADATEVLGVVAAETLAGASERVLPTLACSGAPS